MTDATAIAQVFDDQRQLASDLIADARADIQKAFDALGDSSLYVYDAYEWQTPSPPLILPTPIPSGPVRPGRPKDPIEPTLQKYDITVPNPAFGAVPTNFSTPPNITFPSSPTSAPQDFTGSAPAVFSPTFPGAPTLRALPSDALPYPFITIPDAPVFADPVFDGVKPDDIAQISLQDYLNQLTASYTQFSQQMPALVKDNWFLWFRSMIAENPNVRILDGMVTSYITTGGAGIPVPIEEAIVTRATDRINAEQQRKTAAVWQNMAAKGLTLPSGALMSGLKAARGEMAEGVSKVATDVAIQNLTLEHDHMKFMLSLGREMQSLLMSFAGDTAKVVADINGQAIEGTKLVLTGMIEINNTNVRIYVAKWEGYKAAVEVFRAKWQAVESQIRVYEAEIKAELAKTEINHAVVEVLTAMVNANRSLVEMYKAQVDAESAKVEVSRVQIMAFEAQVRAYLGKVEAYKATWEGYKAGVDGQLAVAKVYESQQMGYKASVDGYVAGIQGYTAQVGGYSAQIEAVAKQNEAALKAWSIEFDGILKGYTADVDAYGRNWTALAEQMRASANATGIQAEFLSKMYSSQLQIDMERAKEHFSLWQQRIKAGLAAAEGITSASNVAASLANSTMNSLTAFAGDLTTGASS